MRKSALITGITGQTGSYLAELLLSKGYAVHGLIRRSSTFNTKRIDHIFDRITLHYGDITDFNSVVSVLQRSQPDEVYNLAAQSHVRVSFDMPVYTGETTGIGVTTILEAIRLWEPNIKYYQASSSEMFGNASPPQNELTPFEPCSPYACAKLYGYWMTRSYRDGYHMYACNGILFNHESPRRGGTFVTRKITRGIAGILSGKINFISLGNLSAKRDWGYAPDYAESIWEIMQQPDPDDYVIGTGKTWSVEQFLSAAFEYVGLNWVDHVRFDPRFMRPNEVNLLQADASKASRVLRWQPSVDFEKLVWIMVDADLEKAGVDSPGKGKNVLWSRENYWHRWEHQVCSMED